MSTESALVIFQKDDLIRNSSYKMISNFLGVKVYSHIQQLQTFYKEYLIGQTLEAEIRINMRNIFFQMLVERFLRKFSFVRSLTRIKNSGKQQQIFKFGTYYIGAKVQRTLFWKFGNGRKRFFRTCAILKGFH